MPSMELICTVAFLSRLAIVYMAWISFCVMLMKIQRQSAEVVWLTARGLCGIVRLPFAIQTLPFSLSCVSCELIPAHHLINQINYHVLNQAVYCTIRGCAAPRTARRTS